MGLSDFYPPTSAIGDLRSDIDRLHTEVSILKSDLYRKAYTHEISTLNSNVSDLANSIRELGSVVDGLLDRLQACEDKTERLMEGINPLE